MYPINLTDKKNLIEFQQKLSLLQPPLWKLPDRELRIGGVFVCFERGGHGIGKKGDRGWAAAVVMQGTGLIGSSVVTGQAYGPYIPNLLALREGPLISKAIDALGIIPDVLLINATGLDHLRFAGMALHIGYLHSIPTVGVTRRPLIATGPVPSKEKGSISELRIDQKVVAVRLRTRANAHCIVVHPAWKTDINTAIAIVKQNVGKALTPLSIKEARRLARTLRSYHTQGRSTGIF